MTDKTDDLDDFRKKLQKIDNAEFNGHTCFRDLTPSQRLDWLAELVVFVYESRSIRISKTVDRQK
jgi:hypothetical protein